MGYRSQVRSLIYGDPDAVCQLVAAHVLKNEGVNVFSAFESSIQRYRITRRVYNSEATAAQPRNAQGMQAAQYDEVETEVLDLSGDSWKWYDDYPDVKAWNALLTEAPDLGLNTEFVRVGEGNGDIECTCDTQDNGDPLLYVTTPQIVADMPDTRPVDYDQQEMTHG